jgi:hypothetical protein
MTQRTALSEIHDRLVGSDERIEYHEKHIRELKAQVAKAESHLSEERRVRDEWRAILSAVS